MFINHTQTLVHDLSLRAMGIALLSCWMNAAGLQADETTAVTAPLADVAQQARTVMSADASEFFESRIRPVLAQHCYSCHSAQAKTLQAGLRLDSPSAMQAGGDSGSLLDADSPDESLLLQALRFEGLEMPPAGRLPPEVIRDFEHWVQAGAPDPRTDPTPDSAMTDRKVTLEEGRRFWAFQIPQIHQRPTSGDEDGSAIGTSHTISANNTLDELIQLRLTEAGLQSNPAADRRTLIRRLSFDVTGLPPSPDAVRDFVNDPSDSAVSDLIDSLLNSSAYGERWARVWLDVARYAEDQAHIVGNNRELFYPNAWRYREWVITALNSDLPYDRFITLQLAADLVEPDNERVQAALGFIGLGPKYYRRNDPEVMAEEWEDRVDVVTRGLLGLTVACARCHDHKFDPVPTEDYYALAGVFASTEMFNKAMVDHEVGKNGHAKNPDEALHVIRDQEPKNLHLMIRGDVHRTGDVVPRGFLQVAFAGQRRQFSQGSGRAELAAAIVDPENPLTARVIVNRIWQQYFGRGLVATSSNFGQLGERPTHPQLLDDLAARFMQNGWSLKWLHRQILTSRTYQQSSELSATAVAIDPDNRLLWRMPRRRLPVEAWRDAVLFVSGQLDQTLGGPSFRPDDPEQVRRTVYAEVSRFELNPLLARFDFPDPNAHSERRVETNTPLQKLFLLNHPFMLKHATALADRILKQNAAERGPEAISDRIDTALVVPQAFQLAFQRDPDEFELTAATRFLKEHPDVGLQQLSQSLLAANEFWWLD